MAYEDCLAAIVLLAMPSIIFLLKGWLVPNYINSSSRFTFAPVYTSTTYLYFYLFSRFYLYSYLYFYLYSYLYSYLFLYFYLLFIYLYIYRYLYLSFSLCFWS